MRSRPADPRNAVLLFDSTCAMCSRLVPWIIDHESDSALSFAGLHSAAGRLALGDMDAASADLDTMYVIEGDRVFARSDAVAEFARHLRWPWRVIRVIVIVPRPIRDAAYRVVARNRQRWFGRRATCDTPPPSVRQRMLD